MTSTTDNDLPESYFVVRGVKYPSFDQAALNALCDALPDSIIVAYTLDSDGEGYAYAGTWEWFNGDWNLIDDLIGD